MSGWSLRRSLSRQCGDKLYLGYDGYPCSIESGHPYAEVYGFFKLDNCSHHTRIPNPDLTPLQEVKLLQTDSSPWRAINKVCQARFPALCHSSKACIELFLRISSRQNSIQTPIFLAPKILLLPLSHILRPLKHIILLHLLCDPLVPRSDILDLDIPQCEELDND